MGKIRVYELAKDMGLENKELLAKLEAAGIEVSSHSSSLSAEDLKKFEAFNNPPEEKIEEARINPGLIRRRRTVVQRKVEKAPQPVETPVTDEARDSDAERQTDEPVAEPTVKAAQEVDESALSVPEVKPAAESEKIEQAESVAEGSEADTTEIPVTDQPAESETKEEKIAAVEAPAKTETKKIKQVVIEKASGDRAKILG